MFYQIVTTAKISGSLKNGNKNIAC